jgi:hypothetical protein
MKDIIWKDIPGYEGLYQVSNDGKVKSCERIVPVATSGKQKVTEKLLKQSIDRGYARVTLSYKGKTIRKTVHHFVALCFIPNPESKKFINHINGVKTDNTVSNLEWCTSSENERHSYSVLKKINSQRKLTTKEVEEIRINAVKGVNKSLRGNIDALAEKYNVNRSTIHNVINKVCYV